jgi:pyruvate,water dikinase
MTQLLPLDQISIDDREQVGDKAFYLGHLKQQHIPVADGWVLPANSWRQYLTHIPWPQPDYIRNLEHLKEVSSNGLQQVVQGLRQTLLATPLRQDLMAALPTMPGDAWILRASLRLPMAGSLPPNAITVGQGMLPAYLGIGPTDQMATGLQRFWGQSLTAANLLVWQHYAQSLSAVGLATMLMPLYPATAAGTLTLAANDRITIDVVQGLGVTLAKGEAIPARCQIDHPDMTGQRLWQPGRQEHQYALVASSNAPGQVELKTLRRTTSDLSEPLLPEHLAQLIDISYQAKAILPSETLVLEWLLYPHGSNLEPTLLITQVLPTQPLPSGNPPAPRTVDSFPANQRPSPLQPPPLATIDVVVKGLGASTGCSQGPAVVAQCVQDLPTPLPKGCIVVLPEVQPDAFLQIQTVGGIVTEKGGVTCHAAILAREVGIPAVVGAPQATQLLATEKHLWLDGERGIVYGLDDNHPLSGQVFTSRAPGMPPSPDQPRPNRYPQTCTKIMVNLSQSQQLQRLATDTIAGVGLLRSEWLLLSVLDGRHPWHWIHQGNEVELQTRIAQQLEPILRALGDKPVRYRSLDLRSHEWQGLEGSPPREPNPMLGLRGTLSYEADSRLFEVELLALASLQRSGYDNIQLMLPFVRTVEEFITCRQQVERVGLTDNKNFALWIMAEVPSVLFLIPAYARVGVQGIAIGSNDLTQLLLAVDRDQPLIASAYDERHPVVRMAIAHLIRQAHEHGIICSICGQAPVRHPELVAELVAQGIDSISVERSALEFMRQTVWQAERTP